MTYIHIHVYTSINQSINHYTDQLQPTWSSKGNRFFSTPKPPGWFCGPLSWYQGLPALQ